MCYRSTKIVCLAVFLVLTVPFSVYADLARSMQTEQVDECTYFVDNQANSEGDGSLSSPWREIGVHLDELEPGDVLCVRGDLSGPGRIYYENTIYLNPEFGVRSGTEVNLISVQSYPGEHVVIRQKSDGDGELLVFSAISYWQWKGIVFDETDASPIVFTDRARGNLLRDCEVRNGGWTGIYIEDGDENTIQNCHLYDFSEKPGTDAHAILIRNGRGNVVSGNTIYNFTGDGVQLIDGNSSGTLIEGNHIYTVDGRCSENAIDIKTIDGVEQTIIRGNLMHGFRETDTSCGGSGSIGSAIVIHKDAEKILIERNEIYDVNGALRVLRRDGGTPHNIQFINNLVHDTDYHPSNWVSGFGVQVWGGDMVDVCNNTFVNVPGFVLSLGKSADLRIQNNVFYNVGDGSHESLSGNSIIDYNGWFPSGVTSLMGPHDIISLDPRFIDLEANDYRLHPDSPAIDQAYSVDAPTYDFYGLSRPYGAGYDLGAFETHMPDSVQGLRVVEGHSTNDQATITLQWTAPGRVGHSSTAVDYQMRYSDQLIAEKTWDSALPIHVPFDPSSPGTREQLVVNDLDLSGGTIYFALRTTDINDNWSDLSNSAFYPSLDVYVPFCSRD